jgi:aminoglycoside phosphotransferase (APT) family kinase protein
MNDILTTERYANLEYIIQDRLGSSQTLLAVEPWGGGACNTCCRVRLRDPEVSYFLKIENPVNMPRTRQGQIERDVAGTRRMQAAGIPVAPVVHYDTTLAEIGAKYLLAEFVDASLVYEIWNDLNATEQAALRSEMLAIHDKMKAVHSPCFGDIYPNGILGQHATWQGAYRSMANILVEDSIELNLYTPQEARRVRAAFENGSRFLAAPLPASFLHLDLGLHNVMAVRGAGGARIRAVIDFGNALFGPFYIEEDGFCQHGGWGALPRDLLAAYRLSAAEVEASTRLFDFELTLFLAAIRWGDYQSRAAALLESCK